MVEMVWKSFKLIREVLHVHVWMHSFSHLRNLRDGVLSVVGVDKHCVSFLPELSIVKNVIIHLLDFLFDLFVRVERITAQIHVDENTFLLFFNNCRNKIRMSVNRFYLLMLRRDSLRSTEKPFSRFESLGVLFNRENRFILRVFHYWHFLDLLLKLEQRLRGHRRHGSVLWKLKVSLQKHLLRVRSGLRAGPRPYMLLYLLPVFPVQLHAFQKQLVLLLRPATDVVLLAEVKTKYFLPLA